MVNNQDSNLDEWTFEYGKKIMTPQKHFVKSHQLFLGKILLSNEYFFSTIYVYLWIQINNY